jgi:hypothetical protein
MIRAVWIKLISKTPAALVARPPLLDLTPEQMRQSDAVEDEENVGDQQNTEAAAVQNVEGESQRSEGYPAQHLAVPIL